MMESTGSNINKSAIDLIEFTTRELNRELVADMVQQAEQSIQLFTGSLDNSLYDQLPFIEAVSDLAIKSPKTRIQILLRDSSVLIKKGHRLIELSRRLTSSIHIHKPSIEDCQHIMELLLIDQKAYLHKKHSDYYHGEACFNNPGQTREWQKQFTQMWDVSSPDPEMRRLHI